MSTPKEDVIIVERSVDALAARFAILRVLSACKGADFECLQSSTRLSWDRLFDHVATLEADGLVRIKSRYEGDSTETGLLITGRGYQVLQEHQAGADGRRRAGQGCRAWLQRCPIVH